MKEDGTCETCGTYARPNGTDEYNRMCVNPDCGLGEIELEDGTCEECGAWTHPDVDARRCIKDTCDYDVEILTVTGQCETCPEYTYPAPLDDNGDSTKCINDTCAYD